MCWQQDLRAECEEHFTGPRRLLVRGNGLPTTHSFTQNV